MGQPPSGGFPPQGQPQPGGYPQQGMGQAGYQQQAYPQAGGPYGQPPKKKTGLIVGLSLGGVAILAAFFITGFAAPGFLLPDGPEDVVEDYTAAAGAQDYEQAKELLCASSDIRKTLENPNPTEPDEDEPEVATTITGETTESGGEARVPVKMEVTHDGKTESANLTFVLKDEEGWCVDKTEIEGGLGGSSEEPSGVPANPTADSYPTGGYGDYDSAPTGEYGDYGDYDSEPTGEYGDYGDSEPTDDYDSYPTGDYDY